ncbi:apoptosis facilitator Bcl-2-like protein 14 isoform X1 [Chelonia mydas]|uniref:apoptosis facilitator Bcl-2-like protein 14 isoform X1 n=2 Tax=Chelonia mydas TaxID=8469 RepID=UPI001CAA0C1A|nr:apoptosis facilitator Bcl-2-like protein 14 isoform X1 [Chelonia mydas]XP_043390024.1 apoptosis facilitator Bcl-2-like protein 14 isoform X1 [Chelonia mydas]
MEPSREWRGKMKSTSDANMEEISLEDEDRDTVEYKVLMAYAQRRLSVSKYGQLLEREAKTLKGSTTERGEREDIPQANEGERHQELSVQDKGPAAQRKKQRKKKFMQRCLLLFSCARGEKEKGPQELATNQDTVNRYGLKLQMALQTSSPESEGEAEGFLHVADRLAELVNARSHSAPRGVGFRALERTPSLEADGGQLKFPQQEGGEKDEEERIIETIVALLRQSGDKLEETIKRDSTFYHCVTKMLSYAFFKKLTDQYLEEVPGDSTKETEGKIQCTKAAFVMEVTTRLTAVDNHPMNMVLGFGVKYLKENFSPWIQNHGGWEHALGLLDEEEVE